MENVVSTGLLLYLVHREGPNRETRHPGHRWICKKPEKTDDGRLVTSYACDSRTVDAEFLLAKRQYIAATGRVQGKDDVIAYHLRQSFVPGEITAEEANRLGMEMARRFTKGNHAFIVCTHIDKAAHPQSYHLERSQPGLRPEVSQFLGQHPGGAAAQ